MTINFSFYSVNRLFFISFVRIVFFFFFFIDFLCRFLQGNSNSFVTIDVSTGFVGFNDYLPMIHDLFIYFSIYLLPIVYQFHLSMKTLEKLQRHVLLTNLICVLCLLIHRNHLFLWTIFAPRLFYQFAQTSSFIIVFTLTTFYRR